MPNLMDRYEDIPEIDRKAIEDHYYGQYLGTDYVQYMQGIKKHNHDYGFIGGHRSDVLSFFRHLDDTKKTNLMLFIEKEHHALFQLLTQLPVDFDAIIAGFEQITKTQSKAIKEITGMYQKDLRYLFWPDAKNIVGHDLIDSAYRYVRSTHVTSDVSLKESI